MITAVDKVAAIRDHGYRVCISHRRRVRKEQARFGMNVAYSTDLMTARAARADGWDIDTHGGETTVAVVVVPPEGGPTFTIAQGRADCSTADRFEKRKGLELAVRRAVAGAPELRPIIAKLFAQQEAA